MKKFIYSLVIGSCLSLSFIFINTQKSEAHCKGGRVFLGTCIGGKAHCHSCVPSKPKPPPRKQGLFACNEDDKVNPIWVSYVLEDSGFSPQGIGYTYHTSYGWHSIYRGKCKKIYSGNPANVIAIRAEATSGRPSWGKERKFCIDHYANFEFTSTMNNRRSKCVAGKGSWVNFNLTRFRKREASYTFW